MKSNIRTSTSKDLVISSPLLFTPSQRDTKRRKLEYDNSESPGFFSPSTPRLSGLFKSPDLPEGAHENVSPRKSKDDSFLIELLKSNSSKRHNESVQFSSQREINEWLFDTPSILKSSPPNRNEGGISRRSLDKLLDPDVSLSWVESMATPPSDSADKNLSIIQEEDLALPQDMNEKRSDATSECIKSADREDEECHCHCDLNSVFQKKVPRKGVARVLFGAEKQESEAANEITDQKSKNRTLNQVEDLDEDLPFICSISSCDDDNFSLSPPVVDTQDNVALKPIDSSQSSAIFSGLKGKKTSQFDDTSNFWSSSKTQNKAAERDDELDVSKSLQQDGNDIGNEDRKGTLSRTLDNIGSPLLTDKAEKRNLDKDSSSIVTSPSIVSKVRYHKEMPYDSVLDKCLDVTIGSKSEDSIASEDVTLTSSPTVVSKAKALLTGTEGGLTLCSTGIEAQENHHGRKRSSVGIVSEQDVDETSFGETTLCKENQKIVEEDTSFSTDISSIFKSPGVATSHFLNKQSSSSVIKNKSILQTPDKVSILNLSGISDTTLSPTVVSRCNTKYDFTPFTSRNQCIEITESTPKISRADLCESTTNSSSISFKDCPLSPSVVKSSLSCDKDGAKAPDQMTTHDNVNAMKDSGQTSHNGLLSQDGLKHRNVHFSPAKTRCQHKPCESSFVSKDKIWSPNASHDCHVAQKSSIADNNSEDESNCLLITKEIAKSHALNTDLKDDFIFDKRGDESLLVSGFLNKDSQSKILNSDVSCQADQTSEVSICENSEVKYSNSHRDQISFDSIDISGHEIKKKDSSEEVECFAYSSFVTLAGDVMSTSHGHAELSTAAVKEHDTSVNGNNASNIQVLESSLANGNANNSFFCSRMTDVDKNEEDRFHKIQSKTASNINSDSNMNLEEDYLSINAEANCSLQSLNSLSLQSDNTNISTEEVMCGCTCGKTKSVGSKQNKEELRSSGKFAAKCSSCDRSETNHSFRICSVEESGQSLQVTPDGHVKERRQSMCQNNIVDMDTLTEIPYDEFDKSFCYKGKGLLGLGNFTEQFLRGDNRSSNECDSVKAEEQDDKTDALVKKDLSCEAGLNKVTLETTDSTFQKPRFDKGITKPRTVKTLNSDKSEEKPDTGLKAKHSRSNDNVMTMSDKQTRQLSDSSAEDMLDELMFGTNEPCRKRKRLEEGPLSLNLVLKDKEESLIDRGIKCIQPYPADVTMGGTTSKKDQTFQGFSTGAEKNITLSAKAMEQTESVFRDTEAHFPVYSKKDESAKCPMSRDGSFQKKESSFQGFSTGSGKKITLSEKAIKRAKTTFEEVDSSVIDNGKNSFSCKIDSINKKESNFKGFHTGNGKAVTTSTKAMEQAKRMFKDTESNSAVKLEKGCSKKCPNPSVDSIYSEETNFKGFRTGIGKAVTTSAKAMEQAKRMFENINATNVDCKVESNKLERNMEFKRRKYSSDYSSSIVVETSNIGEANSKRVDETDRNVSEVQHSARAMTSQSCNSVGVEKDGGYVCNGKGTKLSEDEKEKERNVREVQYSARVMTSNSCNSVAVGKDGGYVCDGQGTNLSEDEKEILTDCLINNTFDIEEFTQLRDNDDGKPFRATSMDGVGATIPLPKSCCGLTDVVRRESCNVRNELHSSQDASSQGAVNASKEISVERGDYNKECDNNVLDVRRTRLRANRTTKKKSKCEKHSSELPSVSIEEASKDEDNSLEFQGFQTGLGKKIQISETSLKNAKKLLHENEDVLMMKSLQESSDTVSCTRSSRETNFLETSKEATTNNLTNNVADSNRYSHCNSKAVIQQKDELNGFSIGLGKSVKISDKAMRAAKKLDESIDISMPGNNVLLQKTTLNSEFTGFSTGTGKKVVISKKALHAAKKRSESAEVTENKDFCSSNTIDDGSKFIGFSTGTGKKVEISKKSLHAAKKRLESVEITENKDFSSSNTIDDGSKFIGFSTGTGNKVEISKKALHAAKERLESVEITENKDFSSSNTIDGGFKFTGFSTGTGKKVEISKKALHAAKKRLESAEITENKDFSSSNTIDDSSQFTGCSTGTGKKVEISKKALHAANKRLEPAEITENKDLSSSNTIYDGSKFTGFSTGTGKKVEISKKALHAAKKILESAEVTENKDFSSSNAIDGGSKFTGFSTGTGKKVEISKKALHAAKKILESVEDGNLDTSVHFEKLERPLADDKRGTWDSEYAGSPKQGLSGVKSCNRTEGGLPEFRKPNSFHTLRKTTVSIEKSTDIYVEMSQRFDEDVMKTMEENPSLLDVKRHQNNSTKSMSPKRNEVELEKENEVPQSRIASNHGDSLLKQEQSNEKSGTVSSKRSVAGLRSKSRKFTFVATPSTPAGYHSDRIAKFTTPLVPKTAVAAEFSTPDTSSRSASEVPKVPPHQSSSKSTPVTSQADLRAKSFSTPFIRNNLNTTRGRSTSSTGKRRSKRPLFSCVPFSNKKQKLDDDVSSTGTEESKIVRQTGRLFLMKKETQQKKRLSQCNFEQQPGCYSSEEAYNLGVSNTVIDVTSENSQSFVFGEEFFSKDTLEKGSITIGDGAVLNLTPEGCAGLQEFKSAFRSLPGVENSLFGDDWLANHYRWIIWKLASMERSFPHMFAGRCLTPNEVMYHLKYRYDKEIDAAERPALKKILERDDVSSRRLVLCVSKIYSNEEQSEVESKDEKSVALDKKFSQQKRIIELTDGWYSVKAALDKPLSNFITTNRICVGLKLCVYGADLIGSEQAVPPLEAPDSLMLVLHANSTRRAHWDAKLGFQTDRRAFPVPLYSLYPDGGLVGCIDIVILRSYPIQWMEKTENGCVFRNYAQEQKVAKKYCEQKQIRMENLYSKIQKQFENSSQPKVTRQSRRRSLNPSVKEIDSMRNGQELYDMLNTVSDPASIEVMLSDSQKELVAQFRHRKEEEQQSLMQKKFDDAWKEIQEEFPDRCVISLQKFRVTDHKVASGKPRTDSFMTVWKPKEEMREILKEGARLKVFHLSTSVSRYKHTRSNVQLATISITRYEELHVESSTHYSKRKIVPFSELRQNNKDGLNEIDVVGYVIYVEQHGSMSELQTVYIADVSETFVAVKIWGGLKAFSLEDTIRPGVLVCIQNLVLKSESYSGDIIYTTFSDLSGACRNPKESYLKKAVNDIKSEIQDVASFVQERQERLKNKLPPRSSKDLKIGNTPKSNDKFLARSNTSIYGSTEKSTPTASADRSINTEGSSFSAFPKIYTPKQCKRPGKEHLTPINLVPDENIKDSIVVNAQKKLNDMKRRALSRYGEPHTFSPSAANITPKARRAFKPPSVTKT